MSSERCVDALISRRFSIRASAAGAKPRLRCPRGHGIFQTAAPHGTHDKQKDAGEPPVSPWIRRCRRCWAEVRPGRGKQRLLAGAHQSRPAFVNQPRASHEHRSRRSFCPCRAIDLVRRQRDEFLKCPDCDEAIDADIPRVIRQAVRILGRGNEARSAMATRGAALAPSAVPLIVRAAISTPG
jgi:hypothetical protein